MQSRRSSRAAHTSSSAMWTSGAAVRRLCSFCRQPVAIFHGTWRCMGWGRTVPTRSADPVAPLTAAGARVALTTGPSGAALGTGRPGTGGWQGEIGRGSGGSLEPPGPPLTRIHTVYMAYSECLPTHLNPLAERICFSQVAGRACATSTSGQAPTARLEGLVLPLRLAPL